MKVLLLNGSANQKGNTFTALSEIAGQLEKNGIEAEIMQLGNKPVRGCIACGQCQAKQLGRCAFDDDICNRIVEKLNASDALVVGSPVYYGQPNGALMALLPRVMYTNSKAFAGTPVASVAIARRGGATAALQTLNMPFQMLDCVIVGSQYWNIAYGRMPGEAGMDTEGMQTMRRLGTNIAWLLKNLHADGAAVQPPREPWAPMHFIRQ